MFFSQLLHVAHLDKQVGFCFFLFELYLLWYAFPFVGTLSLWKTFPLHLKRGKVVSIH